MTTTLLWHDYVVAKVDKLVSDILNPETTISIQQIAHQLNSYYQLMTFHFDNELVYTNLIKWFMGSCYYVCGNHYPNKIIWDEIMVQRFLERINLYQHEFFTAENNFAFQEQRNNRSLSKYMRYIFDNCSRVLIVRIDLKIKAEFLDLVDIRAFHGFMSQIIEDIQVDRGIEKKRKTDPNINNKKGCFEDLRGYAWAIEQGVENGGIHCHLLLLYNGNERNRDWYLGNAVGKHWVEITEGRGWCFNCNTPKQKKEYERLGILGIGMIHRDNTVQVNNAINAALYLTRPEKYEQRLKAWIPNMRSFGRGLISKS